jgi:pantothenate kinase type III
VAAGSLLVDLGNRRLKLARTQEPGQVDPLAVFDLKQPGQFDLALQYLQEQLQHFSGQAWLSSTAPNWLQQILAAAARSEQIRVVEESDLPLSVATVGTGSDRLLAALGAWRRSQAAVVVADLGTAWTLDATSRAGVFLGGAIGPGLTLQEQALAQACPHLEGPSSQPIGGVPSNTADAVAEGTRMALALALHDLAWAYENDLGSPAVRYLSGGDSARIRPWLRGEWQVCETLVLEGLSWLVDSPSSF